MINGSKLGPVDVVADLNAVAQLLSRTPHFPQKAMLCHNQHLWLKPVQMN